jgi:hypothetical protein
MAGYVHSFTLTLYDEAVWVYPILAHGSFLKPTESEKGARQTERTKCSSLAPQTKAQPFICGVGEVC